MARRDAVVPTTVRLTMIVSGPDTPASLELSVVIVNHNGGRFLHGAVGALQENTVCESAEIIVVDSASSDGSSRNLPPGRLPIRVIRCEENVGFCTGNNFGASAARGRLVAFTQPDGVVQAGWDRGLRDAIAPADVAVVGGIVLKMGRDVIDSAGLAIAPNFASWSLCENLTPEQAGFRAGAHRDVVGLSPAFLMVRRVDHLSIGGFWEELWMYGDEPDYAIRIGRLGRSLVCPESRMRHHVGAAAGPHQSPLRLYWSSRNRLLNGARHLPLPRFVLAVALSGGFDAVQLIQQRRSSAFAAVAKGWLAGIRGIRGARRLSTPAERRDAATRLASLHQAAAQQQFLGRLSLHRRR
jgi:N-acetylglucosaminyl-diphospho-decaprenol L-rhamnosyltransferase